MVKLHIIIKYHFCSSVTQSTVGTNEGILDKYTGSGKQKIEKQGVAPMFKPQKDMKWTQVCLLQQSICKVE